MIHDSPGLVMLKHVGDMGLRDSDFSDSIMADVHHVIMSIILTPHPLWSIRKFPVRVTHSPSLRSRSKIGNVGKNLKQSIENKYI